MTSNDAIPPTTVIRSRDGGYFRIPLEQLPEFVLPEGTVVIQWRPGRYLAIPPDRLPEYQMSDDDLVQVFMDSAKSARIASPQRRVAGPRRVIGGRRPRRDL
jgi:hypothetical protein